MHFAYPAKWRYIKVLKKSAMLGYTMKATRTSSCSSKLISSETHLYEPETDFVNRPIESFRDMRGHFG